MLFVTEGLQGPELYNALLLSNHKASNFKLQTTFLEAKTPQRREEPRLLRPCPQWPETKGSRA